MARSVYALLVGINEYQAPLRPLEGCVGDVAAVRAMLEARTSACGVAFRPLELLNPQAERQKVINAFRAHFKEAGPDDVAVFYFSGHGSQEAADERFWHLEPDHLNETLVCSDSVDLADKDLAVLIDEAASRGAHVLVILDACHSGSGTRDAPRRGVRRAPRDARRRLPGSSLSARAARGITELGAGLPPTGRHVLLAACQDNEESIELPFPDRPAGVFTYCLLEALAAASGMPTYHDLAKRIHLRMEHCVADQCPSLETTHPEDRHRPFLGGAVTGRPRCFTATCHPEDEWVIDAGELHGIPRVNAGETTHLALFEGDATDLEDLRKSIGTARVLATLPARSKIELRLAGGRKPRAVDAFKAVITAWPVPPLAVRLAGDPAGVAGMRAALADDGADGTAPMFVREAPARAEIEVRAGPDGFQARRLPGDVRACADIAGNGLDAARAMVARLARLARWQRLERLANPDSRIAPGALDVILLPPGVDDAGLRIPAAEDGGYRFDYTFAGGKWQRPRFGVRLTQASDRRLYCMCFVLSHGEVVTHLADSGGWLDPGAQAWILAGTEKVVTTRVPDARWAAGCSEARDILKIIVGTEPADATLLEQDAIDAPRVPPEAVRRGGAPGGLEQLFERMQGLRRRGEAAPEVVADWRTTEVVITTGRPLAGVALARAGETAVGECVRIQAHPTLEASARLRAVADVGRRCGRILMPALLMDTPGLARPCRLGTVDRHGEACASLVELQVESDAARRAVSTADPLVIRLRADLGPGELVLPMGFDGEFHLPLGSAVRVDDGWEATIARLPRALATRNATLTTEIVFEAIRPGAQASQGRAPALFAVDATGTRLDAPEAVRSRVRAAQRVLLFVRGFLGDAADLAAGAFEPLLGEGRASIPLADRHDVVLGFDYDLGRLVVDDVAQALAAGLRDAGLHAGQGKVLHVVSHSVGNLVVRRFLERAAGEGIVQAFVALGSDDDPGATFALALALNGLAADPVPARWLADLVAASALEQGARRRAQGDGAPQAPARQAPGVAAARCVVLADVLPGVGPPSDAELARQVAVLRLADRLDLVLRGQDAPREHVVADGDTLRPRTCFTAMPVVAAIACALEQVA
jgi:hypothetical protein